MEIAVLLKVLLFVVALLDGIYLGVLCMRWAMSW